MYAALVLVSVLTGPLIVLLAWGTSRLRARHDAAIASAGDELLWALLALAAFGLGAFVSFILLGFAH